MYTICYNFKTDTLTVQFVQLDIQRSTSWYKIPKITEKIGKLLLSMTELSIREGKLQKVKSSEKVPIEKGKQMAGSVLPWCLPHPGI